jgi:hypothetical protein
VRRRQRQRRIQESIESREPRAALSDLQGKEAAQNERPPLSESSLFQRVASDQAAVAFIEDGSDSLPLQIGSAQN